MVEMVKIAIEYAVDTMVQAIDTGNNACAAFWIYIKLSTPWITIYC